jgi:hypothetical protein
MRNMPWSRLTPASAIRRRRAVLLPTRLGPLALAALICSGVATAGVPAWMRDQVNAPLPAHDEKTTAVLLYAETIVTVQSAGKLHRLEREVYRILRPDGAARGTVEAFVSPGRRITNMHAWSLPASGKDYEVRNSDAVEAGTPGAELVSDLRVRLLQIPAAVAGSVVGYEVESDEELHPYLMADDWPFQDTVPVREAHYTLELPPGWHYQATWLNHPEVAPTGGPNRWQWVVSDVKEIRVEADMPPWRGIAGQLWISLVPPNGQEAGPRSWRDLGSWYIDLTHGRRDATPAIRQKVADLTTTSSGSLAKMRALAAFVQNDIRYVAVELGIGGYQPHPAAEVFNNRFGDCKDKVTLLSSMLKEIGIDSSYVIVDTNRGAVTAATPANPGFNHAILAIQLPAGLADPTLLAVRAHPQLGTILFFDPTNPYTPFGSLPGYLQGGYGLVVTPDGGELLQLPQLPGQWNAVNRTAQMSLDEGGTLHGDVHEILTGDRAARQREDLASASQDADHVKAVESHIGSAFTAFQILKATVRNLPVNNQSVEWNYSLEAGHYAKASGDLLLVRPRVLGSQASTLLETREARQNPIEFASAIRDTDTFDIALPAGYQADDLPPAVDLDDGFASYHSKTEVVGRSLRYSRTFEIRELSVPAARATELRDFYRAIRNDERAEAVLKRVP